MHDLDRALLEFEAEVDELEMGGAGDYELGADYELEGSDQYESDSEFEAGGDYEFEGDYEMEGDYELEGDYEMEAAGDYEFEHDPEMEGDYEFEGDYEREGDYELEADYEREGDYELEADYEMEGDYEFESSNGYGMEVGANGDAEAVFDEVEEMELASNLLAARDEREMDQELLKSLGKAFKKIGSVLRTPEGMALRVALKGVAKTVLPMAGGVLGNLAVPGVGGAIGSQLGPLAAKAFGLELEGMSPQDQELEIARRFIRLTGAAAREVADNPNGGPPIDAAKTAVFNAARTHAPGLVGGAGPNGNGGGYYGRRYRRRRPMGAVRGGRRMSGRWVRRGRRIILLGI
jgi:hypothetical protein